LSPLVTNIKSLNLNMTATQIKSEIQKALDAVPENVLQDVLVFLKELQKYSADDIKLTANLRQILIEDKELLEKLAQ
ncbi:MAG: hypothetical protein ACXVJB_04665, partial [Mucilaginibacter sp.]